ncbi:MAG: glycoside hydrolase family 2 TIM barrel-domain containing protein [Mucilaginibacter sp.]
MRFKIPALFCMLLSLVFTGRLCAQQNKSYLFNDGWLFHKGDIAGGEKSVATSEGWRAVQLPHDWSIEGPFSDEWASATAYLPGGIGWYKKTFIASAQWKGKKVFICFDGVYKNSEVWINGHYLGKRPNGFVPFKYELTPYLNSKDKKNLITVKADHSEFADSRWYTGSGIYRDVRLVVKNPVYVQPADIAFSTPKVSAKSATIQVEAAVTNSTGATFPVALKILLIDAKGKVAAQDVQKLSAKPGVNAIHIQKSISDPVLWSAENPNLYRLKLQVIQNGKVADEETQQVGIRSIRFDKDNGFFLNGKNLKMKGVCIHDDAGALGVAVPPEVWVRHLKTLKEAGVNALRLSHNPHADYLYDLCDQMGFLVMDEAFDEWEIGKNKWVKGWNVGTPSKNGYHEYFKEWAHRDLEAMIKRDRNHPSVILWSIGNEIDYPNDPYSHPVLDSGKNPQIYGRGYSAKNPPASDLTLIAKDLVKTVKMFDTTRPVTAALAGVVMSNKVGYPEALDIVGYNYEEYRYADDHKLYPNRIIYGSENGMALQAWQAVDTNKYISGQYLWTGIDYLGEAGKWPQRSNGAGLIDLAGFRKPEYYYRQSLWAHQPMVYLGVKEITQKEDGGIWSHRNVQSLWNWPDKGKLRVECFTNCKEAELFLNGRSLGKVMRDTSKGQVPAWIVGYQPGELSVKGYNEGKTVAHYTIKTFGAPAQIKANPDQIIFSKSKKGLCQVELQIADKDGNPVYVAENDVSVTISGDAKLLGLESGSTVSHESYQANHRQALHGRLIAYIQPGRTAGKIAVSFYAAGLKPASVALSVK